MASTSAPSDDRSADAVRRANPSPTTLLVAVVLSAVAFGAVGFLAGQSVASGDEVATEQEADPATGDPAEGDGDATGTEEEDADDVPAVVGDEDVAEPDDAGDADGAQEAGREGIDDLAAELSEGQQERHLRLVEGVTEAATTTRDELLPVLAELYDAVPGDGVEDEPADPGQLEAWRQTLQQAQDRLTGLGPGSTAVNGTRGTFLGTVRQLDAAVAAYDEALVADDGEQRSRLVALTAQIRDDAVSLWTVGAEQLDLLNIDAHGGHVHLYLSDTGDPDDLTDEFREPTGPGLDTHDHLDDHGEDDHGEGDDHGEDDHGHDHADDDHDDDHGDG